MRTCILMMKFYIVSYDKYSVSLLTVIILIIIILIIVTIIIISHHCRHQVPAQNLVHYIKVSLCLDMEISLFLKRELFLLLSPPLRQDPILLLGQEVISIKPIFFISGIKVDGQVDLCKPNPCQNNGTCMVNGNTSSCQCPEGQVHLLPFLPLIPSGLWPVKIEVRLHQCAV